MCLPHKLHFCTLHIQACKQSRVVVVVVRYLLVLTPFLALLSAHGNGAYTITFLKPYTFKVDFMEDRFDLCDVPTRIGNFFQVDFAEGRFDFGGVLPEIGKKNLR